MLIPAICTNCGATVSVDRELQTAKCPYCGQEYFVENAAQRFFSTYQITNHIQAGTVEINQYAESDTDRALRQIDGMIKIQEYSKALKRTIELNEKDPSVFQAWIYRAILVYDPIGFYQTEKDLESYGEELSQWSYEKSLDALNKAELFVRNENEQKELDETREALKKLYQKNAVILSTWVIENEWWSGLINYSMINNNEITRSFFIYRSDLYFSVIIRENQYVIYASLFQVKLKKKDNQTLLCQRRQIKSVDSWYMGAKLKDEGAFSPQEEWEDFFSIENIKTDHWKHPKEVWINNEPFHSENDRQWFEINKDIIDDHQEKAVELARSAHHLCRYCGKPLKMSFGSLKCPQHGL